MSDQDMVLSAANSKNTQFRVSGTLSAQRKLTLSQAQLSGAYKWVENVTNKSLEVAFATGASVIIPSMSAAKVYSDGVDCQAMQIGAVTFDAVNAALATANATINVNSQKITGVANGSANSDAVNYAQLTAATFAGKPKTPAAAVATSPITGLTGLAKTIDGVAIDQANMTVLLVAQADAKDNGWWLSQSGAWTRPANFANGESADGSFGFVDQNGTSFGGSSWWCDTVGATVGTSNLTFLQFNGLADVNAGDGLTKTGNTLNVGANGDGSIVVNSDNIQVGVINATQHGTLVGGDLHELVSDSTAGFMAPAEHTKLAGVANNATYSPQGSSNPFAVSTSASAGTSTYVSREDHVHALPFSTVQSVLAAATGSISVNSQKITNLAAASSANDALAYGQSGASLAGLNSTGDIAMNSHKVSGLASASSSGDAIAYGQSGASLAGLDSTGAIAMNSHKVSGLADASLAGDALAYGQSSAMLAGLDVNSNKITSLASASASGDALAYGQSSAMLAGLNVNNEKITNLATPALSSDAATKGYVDGKAATAAPENVGTSASVGSSSKYALEDHVHDLSFSTAKSVLGEADSSIGLNGQKFTNLADANDAGQALIYGQSGASLGTGASIGSLTMSGQISMGSTNKIVNLAAPTASSDAATKGYVDGKAATAAPENVGTSASVGSSAKYALEDHVHDLPESTFRAVAAELTDKLAINGQNLESVGTLKFSNGLSVESLSGLTAGSAAHEYAELLRANSSAVTLPANSACTISVTAGGIDANGNSFKYAGLYEAVTDGSSNITWKSVDEQYSDINDTGFQFELDQTVTNAVSVYLETGASAVKAKIVGSMNITSIAKPV